MSHDVVRAAIWANDLRRLHHRDTGCSEYAMVEVRSVRMAVRLSETMEVDERVVHERLDRGCRAFAAWSWLDEAPVSWLWVSTGDEYAPPLQRTFRIPEGDCYGWNAGTVELHRGRGLFVSLLEWAGSLMAESGMRVMWNGILDDNLPSQRAHARAGFRPVLRTVAVHEPSPGRLRTWPADYADERLVGRARQLLQVKLASSRARSAA
jgi:hypothetical protein